MLLGLELDLAQPTHVRERSAERGDVDVDRGTEVPQPPLERLAAERAPLEILLEQRLLQPARARSGRGDRTRRGSPPAPCDARPDSAGSARLSQPSSEARRRPSSSNTRTGRTRPFPSRRRRAASVQTSPETDDSDAPGGDLPRRPRSRASAASAGRSAPASPAASVERDVHAAEQPHQVVGDVGDHEDVAGAHADRAERQPERRARDDADDDDQRERRDARERRVEVEQQPAIRSPRRRRAARSRSPAAPGP